VSDKVTYPSGATRSADADDVRYDLIPMCVLRRYAKRMAKGAKVHGPNNWLGGFPPGVIENHMWRHYELWKAGDLTDDHLGAFLWGAAALVYFDENPTDG